MTRLRDTVDVECDLLEKGDRAALVELYENAPAVWLRYGSLTRRLAESVVGTLPAPKTRRTA